MLEYLPPINNSASNEKTLRWRVHFFFLLTGACFSVSSRPTAVALLFRLLMQKNKSAIAAKTTTTTGTATAACIPGEDNPPEDSLCKSLVAPAVALDATELVTELAVCEDPLLVEFSPPDNVDVAAAELATLPADAPEVGVVTVPRVDDPAAALLLTLESIEAWTEERDESCDESRVLVANGPLEFMLPLICEN